MSRSAHARKPSSEPEESRGDRFVVLPPDELEDLLRVDVQAEEEDRRGACTPADELIVRLRQRLALAR